MVYPPLASDGLILVIWTYRKPIRSFFSPFRRTPPVVFTWPSIFPAYAGVGLHGLEIELLDRLRRHEAHPRTLHRFGNRLGVCKMVLLPPEIRLHVLRRHQPCVMAERLKLSAQMVRANAGLHADQTRRQVALEACLDPTILESKGRENRPAQREN